MNYSNGLAPKSALVKFEGHWCSPDMYARLSVAVPKIRKRGVKITINQIYRFLGNSNDRLIGRSDYSDNEAKAGQTSTGDANQNYLKGKEDNKSGASAATPGFSNHGDFIIGAVDSDTNNIQVRNEEFNAVGLVANVSGETWHHAGIHPFDVPVQKEEDEMKLIAIYCDKGTQGDEWASTAVILPSGKWQRTSTGTGPRDALDGIKAIAADLDITIDEQHVDNNGYKMAQVFV